MTGKTASMSNYPNGFSGGLSVRGVPLAVAHPGKVFYVGYDDVNSVSAGLFPNRKGASDGNVGTFLAPFQTLEYAMSQCVANRGDIIYVLPGHAETIVADGGLALDVAGVAIVNLGTGTNRPLYLIDIAAAAAITVTAANISFIGGEVRASFADVTNAFDVTAAWFNIDGVEFTEEGANLNFVDYIHCSATVDNTADGLSVTNCVGTAIDAAQNSFVLTAADIDRLVFSYNFYSSAHASTIAAVEVTSPKTITDCVMVHNLINMPGVTDTSSVGSLVNGAATDNTGIVAFNVCGHADTAAPIIVDLDGVRQFENYSASEATTSGGLRPVVDDFT